MRDQRSSGGASTSWYGCYATQDVYPYSIKFAKVLREGSPDVPRAALGTGEARMLAREPLTAGQPTFGAAFTSSPMKRAK